MNDFSEQKRNTPKVFTDENNGNFIRSIKEQRGRDVTCNLEVADSSPDNITFDMLMCPSARNFTCNHIVWVLGSSRNRLGCVRIGHVS